METLTFEITFKETPDLLTIKFSGNLVINYIEEIISSIKEKIDLSKNLHIKISNPDNIDLTFAQLVISLQKTYLQNNREFTISARIKEDLKLLLANTGFNIFLN